MVDEIAIVGRAGVDVEPEDAALARALRRGGCRTRQVGWDDPAIDWSSFATIVIRSCWNYHHQPDRFLSWLDGWKRTGLAFSTR